QSLLRPSAPRTNNAEANKLKPWRSIDDRSTSTDECGGEQPAALNSLNEPLAWRSQTQAAERGYRRQYRAHSASPPRQRQQRQLHCQPTEAASTWRWRAREREAQVSLWSQQMLQQRAPPPTKRADSFLKKEVCQSLSQAPLLLSRSSP